MADDSYTFSTPGGGKPGEVLLRLEQAVKITKGDRLMVGNYFKEQMLERTANNVDVNGYAFAPYSTKGPYYYYPSGHPGRSIKQRKDAVNRFLRITHKTASDRSAALFQVGKRDAAEKSSTGGVRTRSGLGIRFESYAAFKESLGRAGVDLLGARAPHMLQALTVRVGEDEMEVAIGIYDAEKAAIAKGHQYGTKYLPVRRFIGATQANAAYALKLLVERVRGRIKSGASDT